MAPFLSRPLLRAQSDRRLIGLAAGGSAAAFETIVERYRAELVAHARRLLLPAPAAEDAVQNACLDAWRALERGTEVTEPRAWLHSITHRAALAGLRESGYDHAELHEALQGGDAPDEDLERRTAVRQALAGLAALPELQREALLRTAIEGQSHASAAREMGVEESALRGLVYRGRSTLRGAATALTPAPLLAWAAGLGGLGGSVAAGGATAALGGGLLAKAGATLAVTGALAGGGIVVERELTRPDRDAGPDAPATQAGTRVTPAAAATTAPGRSAPGGPEGPRTAVPGGTDGEGGASGGARRAADEDREDRGRGRGRGRGRSGSTGRPVRDDSGTDDGDEIASGDDGSGGQDAGGGRGRGRGGESGSGSGSGREAKAVEAPAETEPAGDDSGSGQGGGRGRGSRTPSATAPEPTGTPAPAETVDEGGSGNRGSSGKDGGGKAGAEMKSDPDD